MAKITRRTFIAAASAIPFAVWFEQNAFAKTPLVRYNARSAYGQQMLKIYAKAVAAMQAKPPGDPIGWLFQWYTHAVRPDRTKAAEISSIYPSPSPQKTLAQAAWSTCQAHFDPSHEDFFLPWHRMYVYFFEHIIRKISGVKTFTLPYWNYSASGAAHGVIPKHFRLAADPLFKSLYMQNRNTTPDVNGGEAIDKFDPGALALTSLAQCTYSPLGALPGFCMALDSACTATCTSTPVTAQIWVRCPGPLATPCSGCTIAISTACGQAGTKPDVTTHRQRHSSHRHSPSQMQTGTA